MVKGRMESIITIGRFAAEQGDNLLRGVTTQIVRAIKVQGADEMHDLRVAIRRFTRILIVLKPCFPRSESRRIRRGLKQIMTQAGDVRDYDIAMHLIEKTELPQAIALIGLFREKRKEAARLLAASLRRWVKRNLPARWRNARKAEGEPKGADGLFCATPIDVAAKRILPPMIAEHFRSGKIAADERASVHKIHRFRIEAKGLRYTLDFFAPLYGESLAGLANELKDLQSLSGDINDAASARRLLSHYTSQYPKEAKAAGGKEFSSFLKKRQHKKTEEFREQYGAAFSDASVLRLWKDTVGLTDRARAVPGKTPRHAPSIRKRKRATSHRR